ncbi:MAG TPA: helix-turn-helix domain-containing protein [Acidimicrobiales bacterium]|nr:helix-turn-helix domain-containing protein [Acidimicrobiales bacterium]
MGRTAIYDEDTILEAATAHIAAHGGRASVAALARSIGAPSGSIYHRFASRDALIAAVWLRALRSFQGDFLAALDHPDVDQAALAAARHVPEWCAESLDQAMVLHRYRIEDLVATWPAELAPDRDTLNAELFASLRRHSANRYGSASGSALDRTTFALVDVPGAAVRRFLDRHEAPPPWSVDAVGSAALAILRDDRDHR